MTTMHLRFSLALGAGLLALGLVSSHAATPMFWQVSTQAEFLKGEVENLSIDGSGRLVLGPATETLFEATAPFLWSLVRMPDGTLLAGSGNEGQVFRIDRDGRSSVFFDGDELEAHALAVAPDGSVYVGTSPDGQIYRVDPAGQARPHFDPEDKYIWSLVVAGDGMLLAGTGDRGGIYRITPDGKGELLYRTRASHVLSLLVDGDGQVLAGTESPGQVLRVDAAGKAFVLLDSPYREIRALAMGPSGVLYAGAVSGRPVMRDRPAEPTTPDEPARPMVPTVSAEITGISIGDVSVSAAESPLPAAPSPREERGSKGAVYRVAPDGLWDVIWESPEDLPYALSVDGDGLLIGTGSKGKVYRLAVAEPSRLVLLTRAAAQQVTSFYRDPEGGSHDYVTANPGKLVRLSAARATRGVYRSEVRDATTAATWGAIRWRAVTPPGTSVALQTRSGNTAGPDETWSPWSEPYSVAEGTQITSPKARYLQWRVTLTGSGETPVLTSVTTAYLPRNLRPEVASITVYPPGTIFQKPFSTGEFEIAGLEERAADLRQDGTGSARQAGAAGAPALGRRTYQKGLQTFVWKASDPNDDQLQYDLLYRREGETSWKTLRTELGEPIFVWDTTSVPDGTYVIRVVASDTKSNSPGTALTGGTESTAFDIDNTPPTVQLGVVRMERGHALLPFTVRDAQSPIQRVEYSLDANRWRVVYPKDGIPDSRSEQFELLLNGEDTARSVIIRATDALNNTATAVAEPVATR